MGKTYIETIKYMIIADYEVSGLVEKPDVIGAIFGQSEGLLGSDLDIKELQQNGKIGRIEITVNHTNNKTSGELRIPCSLSMVETSIIAASMETIEKVGPCDAYFKVKQIEDTRGLKRKQIKSRAIDLLGRLIQEQIPDTRELMDEIMDTFKTREIIEYGPDKLAAGPSVDDSNELIVVEGRADVLNLLKYGVTNVISTGGARIPRSLADIAKSKSVTLFLDGDRGADIQLSQLLKNIKVDYVARAPDGKEVEELTQKEINQALRRRMKPGFSGNERQDFYRSSDSIVKQTKFSVTNEHRVNNPLAQQGFRRFDSPRPEQRPIEQSSEARHFENSNISHSSSHEQDITNALSGIPVERIDVAKQENGFGNRGSFGNRRNDFNGRDGQNRRFNNGRFDRRPQDNRYMQNGFGRNQQGNVMFNGNRQEIQKQVTVIQQQILKPIAENSQVSESIKQAVAEVIAVPVSVETMPVNIVEKKPIVLPELTDELKKQFQEILEEVKKNKESRILNEKLRRIGGASSNEFVGKLNGFKSNKLYAIVTDLEINDELLKVAKDKGALFLVAPKSKIDDDKDIHIVVYE